MSRPSPHSVAGCGEVSSSRSQPAEARLWARARAWPRRRRSSEAATRVEGPDRSARRLEASCDRLERSLELLEATCRGSAEEGIAGVALAQEVVDLGRTLEGEPPAERRAAVEADRPEPEFLVPP